LRRVVSRCCGKGSRRGLGTSDEQAPLNLHFGFNIMEGLYLKVVDSSGKTSAAAAFSVTQATRIAEEILRAAERFREEQRVCLTELSRPVGALSYSNWCSSSGWVSTTFWAGRLFSAGSSPPRRQRPPAQPGSVQQLSPSAVS